MFNDFVFFFPQKYQFTVVIISYFISPVWSDAFSHCDFNVWLIPYDLSIISTDNKSKLYEELKRADAVLLTYACDQPMTLSRLTSYWLNELRQLEVKAPVILVGCKLDLRDEHQQVSMEDIVAPIMKQFREIETCIECSAATLLQVFEKPFILVAYLFIETCIEYCMSDVHFCGRPLKYRKIKEALKWKKGEGTYQPHSLSFPFTFLVLSLFIVVYFKISHSA